MLPRFVILRHEMPPGAPRDSHWDWMFADGDHLATWSTSVLPDDGIVRAEKIADHRTDYLDYEGPVSGGRGTVRRVDRGPFEKVRWDDRHLELRLHGSTWDGTLRLQLDSLNGWLLSFNQSKKESACRERP